MPERGWPARRPLSASAKLRKRLLASSSMRFCGALSVRPAKAAPSVPHCFLALCPVLLRSVRGTKIVTNETEPQTRTAISGGRAARAYSQAAGADVREYRACPRPPDTAHAKAPDSTDCYIVCCSDFPSPVNFSVVSSAFNVQLHYSCNATDFRTSL